MTPPLLPLVFAPSFTFEQVAQIAAMCIPLALTLPTILQNRNANRAQRSRDQIADSQARQAMLDGGYARLERENTRLQKDLDDARDDLRKADRRCDQLETLCRRAGVVIPEALE